MARFLLVSLVSLWVVAIAIIAAQNGTSVTLRLLMFQSVPLPFGLVLAFCAVGGMLGTAIALSIGGSGSRG